MLLLSGRVLLIAATIGPFVPAQAQAQDAPRIVVEGYGVAETPPDLVTIGYDIRGEGKTSDDAVRDLVAKTARISGRMQAVDPLIAPETKDMTVTGVRGSACGRGANDDDDDVVRLSTGPCAIAGYVAEQSFTFKSKQVKDAATLVGIAGQAGATRPNIRSFAISDERALKRKAVSDAYANARAKAQVVAQASGTKLGPIISANLDRAYGDDDDAIVITGSRIARPDLEAPSPVTVVMNVGPIKTSATLKVTFGVIQ
ncbi:MAG: SIMPL domain-containing protein [Sphingomicrobium sp.]